MLNKKLILSLNSLNMSEFNQFSKFVKSPIYNKHEKVNLLFEFIKKNRKKPPEKLSDEKRLFEYVLDGVIDYPRLYTISHQLLNLLDEFLMWKEWKEEGNRYTYLLQACRKRKLSFRYNDIIRKIQQKFSTPKHIDSSYYFSRHHFEFDRLDLPEKHKRHISPYSSTYRDLTIDIDLVYFIEKLRAVCHLKYLYPTLPIEDYFLEKVIDQIEGGKIETRPFHTLTLFYHCFRLIGSSVDLDEFIMVKDLFIKKFDILKASDKTNIATYLTDYSIRELNRGNRTILPHLLDLYSFQIERWVFEGTEIPINIFNNVVTCGLLMGKYDWAESFIKKHASGLPEEHQNNAKSINLAQVYWKKKNYIKVIDTLRDIEYGNTKYDLISKKLLLCTYYELDEIEALYAIMESSRAFLHRNARKNIPRNIRKGYLDLIAIVKQLTRVLSNDSKAIEQLKSKVTSNNNIVGREWLLEKIAELE